MSTTTLHFIRKGEENPSCVITTELTGSEALEDLFRAANRVDGSEAHEGPHRQGFTILMPVEGPSMGVGDAALMLTASGPEMWFCAPAGWSQTPIKGWDER